MLRLWGGPLAQQFWTRFIAWNQCFPNRCYRRHDDLQESHIDFGSLLFWLSDCTRKVTLYRNNSQKCPSSQTISDSIVENPSHKILGQDSSVKTLVSHDFCIRPPILKTIWYWKHHTHSIIDAGPALFQTLSCHSLVLATQNPRF